MDTSHTGSPVGTEWVRHFAFHGDGEEQQEQEVWSEQWWSIPPYDITSIKLRPYQMKNTVRALHRPQRFTLKDDPDS
jgi:hypothetical protein